MSDHYPTLLPSGGVLQAGIPTREGGPQTTPGGLMMRGVVVATYVVDDPNHPYASSTTPVAVYCDVLTYAGVVGSRFQFFQKCLVSQELGHGMQRGRIWRPRATTMDISGNTLNLNQGSNPADMDGDHVLLGFMDGSVSCPVILRGIPHPSVGAGHTASEPVGARPQLVLADGDPDFRRHHGAWYGLSDKGDMVVDLSGANTGVLQSDGTEPALTQDGTTGNLLSNIEQNAKRLLQLLDMSNAQSPQPKMTELLKLTGYILDFMAATPAWQIKAGSDNVVQAANKGANTTFTVGDGSKHVPVVEALKAFWSNVKTYLDSHTHPTSTGPSGPPTQAATSWDTSIESTKISIPNG